MNQVWYNESVKQRRGAAVNSPRHDPKEASPVGTSHSTPKRFYVYVLCRPNGKPFYVGKGSGPRVFRHDEEARSGHRCHKCNVIRKIWRQGGQVQRYILFETDDEQAALAYECEVIALYGRDTLANATDGGEGVTGLKHSAASKARMKAAHIGRKTSLAARLKHAISAKAQWEDPEVRTKRIVAIKTRMADPAVRAEMSRRAKEIGRDPAERTRRSERGKARMTDPVERERMKSLGMKSQWTSERRAKTAADSKARWQTNREEMLRNSRNRPATKLTIERAVEIRQRCAAGESRKALSKAFGVSKTTIAQIVRGESWKD